MRLLAILLMTLIAAPPATAADWYAEILGPYGGPVLNGGTLRHMHTDFFLDHDGHLTGRYHVDDPVPFDGTLDDFHEDAPFAGSFTWHDRYGDGMVHVIFDPDRDRFIGTWGDTAPADGNTFNGHREGGPRVRS